MAALEPEKLKYHQAALDLIGHKPVFSADAIQQIQEFEERHNIKLPASVKEWYSLADGVKLLKDYSNSDHPEPLHKMKLYQHNFELYRNKTYFDGKLLYFMNENQSVTAWYIQVDDSDDPPVFYEDFEGTIIFRLAARKFSEFIYTRIWDFGEFNAYPYDDSYSWDTQLEGFLTQKVSEEVLNYFRSILTQEPDYWINDYFQTYRGDIVCYRFHKENKFLLISSYLEDDDLPDWKIWAKSGQELLELLQIMRACPYATENESSQWIKNEEDLANYFS